MPPWISQFVTTYVMPLAVAVVTAVLTVQLSFKRFQAERWWDRKAEAYSKIIEALHHAVAYTSMVYSDWVENVKPAEDYKERLEESYSKAKIEIEIASGVGAYIISDEVAKVLAQLQTPRPRHENVADMIDDDQQAYGEALTKIRELAKKDLKVR